MKEDHVIVWYEKLSREARARLRDHIRAKRIAPMKPNTNEQVERVTSALLGARLCTECRFETRNDVGYSNWTVEGTEYGCLLGKRETLCSDGTSEAVMEEHAKIAQKCGYYMAGTAIYSDVDGEQAEESLHFWIDTYIKP